MTRAKASAKEYAKASMTRARESMKKARAAVSNATRKAYTYIKGIPMHIRSLFKTKDKQMMSDENMMKKVQDGNLTKESMTEEMAKKIAKHGSTPEMKEAAEVAVRRSKRLREKRAQDGESASEFEVSDKVWLVYIQDENIPDINNQIGCVIEELDGDKLKVNVKGTYHNIERHKMVLLDAKNPTKKDVGSYVYSKNGEYLRIDKFDPLTVVYQDGKKTGEDYSETELYLVPIQTQEKKRSWGRVLKIAAIAGAIIATASAVFYVYKQPGTTTSEKMTSAKDAISMHLSTFMPTKESLSTRLGSVRGAIGRASQSAKETFGSAVNKFFGSNNTSSEAPPSHSAPNTEIFPDSGAYSNPHIPYSERYSGAEPTPVQHTGMRFALPSKQSKPLLQIAPPPPFREDFSGVPEQWISGGSRRRFRKTRR